MVVEDASAGFFNGEDVFRDYNDNPWRVLADTTRYT